jgi:uncharacterized membrane protein YjfL (UPF0719 family)
MSADEVFVTVTAFLLGPILWALWLYQMSHLRVIRHRNVGTGTIALALLACAIFIFIVLRTSASHDVVDAPAYVFMYVVLGLAWSRVTSLTFGYAGLNARDDVVERANKAAVPALAGALVGVTLCYAGGNVGDGPGWWVVLFSAGLATATLLVAWLILVHLTPVADAVAIDRDPAAGVRLGAFLVACGIVLGRAVAGDWYSAGDTVGDFVPWLPTVLTILIVAVVVERLARPTPERPRAPVLFFGVLPALLYLIIAVATVSNTGWPE